MSMDNFEQQSANDTDAVTSVATDFSSLHSALQHNYEGNNILNITAQLMRIYQPEDGIIVYERVLKKVQSLLEDCDSYKKQLLLSIIPTPNNVPNHMIKKIFRTTTGFIKLNLQKNSMFQSMFGIKNMDGIMDNSILSSKQCFLYDKNALNFKSSFSEAYPFRGFPESEISTIRSHVKNADSSIYQSSNNSNNLMDRNNKYQMSSYRQYLLNKKYCASARISTSNESHLCYSSQTVYQDTCCMKTCNSIDIIADLWQDKIPRQFNDVKCGSKKCEDTNVFDKDNKSGISYMIIDIGQNAAIKQMIKDNIYKMDVCWDEDQNVVVDADDLLAIARDKLKTSLNNFLKRAQEGTSIELSAFPHIRSYPQVSSLNSIYFISKNQKPGTPHKILGKDFTSDISSSDSCLFLKRQNADINLQKNQRTFDEGMKHRAFTCVSGLQTKYSSQELNKANELQVQKNNLDYVMKKKTITVECKENNKGKSIYRCKMAGSELNDVNSENNFQAQSMSQLAAYKKQYYDTLLSVQRAKVAIRNSLVSSSDRLTDYDDPYYSNNTCQQQHLFRQRHFMVRPQFSTYPTSSSGLSSVHNNQYSCTRSDCKYLLLKQLRSQRQTPPLYARNQSWIQRYIGPMYPYPFMPNGNNQTKYCVRRKTLEDIVEKLKEIERTNVND